MSKTFDNSGKNTENEMYDTSHRQYWAPPGSEPWKDNLIGFFGIVFSIILVVLIDCFILHPIPAPEGTFDVQNRFTPDFVLADSGCEYADAKIRSSDTSRSGMEVYLVEQNGETHLILFKESLLFTRKIAGDVLLTATESQKVRLGNWPFFVDVTVKSGRITDVSAFGSLIGQSRTATITCYALVGVAIALAGSFIWHKIKNLFK